MAIQERQKDNGARQQLEEVVVDLVHKRIAQYMYTGLCLRKYSSSCPKGWRFESGHCEAHFKYVGQRRHVIAPQSDEDKAELQGGVCPELFCVMAMRRTTPSEIRKLSRDLDTGWNELRCNQELPWHLCFCDGFQFVRC